jgi:crotonobetainyl-CoA:carnitine CoA-transferase CaiB-like acyl-CoA transferase
MWQAYHMAPLAPEGGRAERDAATAPIRPGPPKNPNRAGYFNDINAGRKGISLNVRHPEGKELFKLLLAISDVFVEGFTAKTTEKWGLAFAEQLTINPRIVYCQQPGFGYHGQYRDLRTVGPIANALSGLTEMVGLPAPYPPAGWGYSYTDWTGAYNLALAVLAGLVYQRRTGKGIWIDASQVESGIAYTGTALLDYQVNAAPYVRTGNRSPGKRAAPHGAYRCTGDERWLAIAVFSDEEWQAFRRVIGNPAWTADDRFATFESRIAHQDELDALVETWTTTQDAFEAMHALQQAGVAAGVCQTAQDRVEADPQLSHLEWLTQLPQTEIGTWPVKQVPIAYSKTPADQAGLIKRGAPSYGEDNRAVFSELLGLSDSEIERLVAEDVI